MLKGVCTVCGKNKASFVSTKTGEGFSLNNLVNNLPIELHQFAEKGEDVPNGSFNGLQKYSFCGPGTRYEQRMKEGYKGINELDRTCRSHDQPSPEYLSSMRSIIERKEPIPLYFRARTSEQTTLTQTLKQT